MYAMAGQPRSYIFIHGRAKRYFSSTKCSDWLGGLPSFQLSEFCEFFVAEADQM
jgi:hypothetical protein